MYFCKRICTLKFKTLTVFLSMIIFCPFIFILNLFTNKVNSVGECDENCIRIGVVLCGGTKYLNTKSNETFLTRDEEQTLILIKSILLSAKSYNVKQPIEITLFTDSLNLRNRIQNKLTSYTNATNGHVTFSVRYYSVFSSLPEYFERLLIDGEQGESPPLGCRHVRLFFADFLPPTTKKILYLDTDNIIVGNISHIWETMADKTMINSNSEDIFATLVLNMEPDDLTHERLHNALFGKIPHVSPRGVNSGVILMNLDAMRKYNFTALVMSTFNEYKAARRSDQVLLNILLHFNQQRVKLVSCQYNFLHIHCEAGLTCREAARNENGIQIIHGAGERFTGKLDRTHCMIYKAYKDFDWQHFDSIREHLYKPLRILNNSTETSMYELDNCRGNVGNLLYTKLFLEK